MKKFLTAGLLASAIAGPAMASEFIANGGFEDPNGLDYGWSHTVSDTLDIITGAGAVNSGNFAARFYAPEPAIADILYQSMSTIPGQVYNYSFWVAGFSSEVTPSSFLATIGDTTIINLTETYALDYTQFYGSYLATSYSTELYFKAFSSLGIYLLDDVSVTGPSAADCETRTVTGACAGGSGAVPEPGTWALMLVGFGGLGAALRRRKRQALALQGA